MEWKELEKKSANELKKILSEERSSLHELRLKLSVNQLKDVRSVRKKKKLIARIETRISQLEGSDKVIEN
ncbi:MAG: 50S ribosomal protein L29 [Candidatus Uhrbacteria bacterium]|nr:50S ribosomal protein L29 [Candidatus Uhrbacteria bacterium]